jgi:hypothetical protein
MSPHAMSHHKIGADSGWLLTAFYNTGHLPITRFGQLNQPSFYRFQTLKLFAVQFGAIVSVHSSSYFCAFLIFKRSPVYVAGLVEATVRKH